MSTPEDIPELDLRWLAGLLEGEGCFKSSANGISIILGMTDKDTVERVSELWEKSLQNPRAPGPIGHKDMHYVQINGDVAARWMVVLRPFMFSRRKEAIDKALAKWRLLPGKSNALLGIRQKVTNCKHTDRKHASYGMCGSCATKQWRIRHEERISDLHGVR